MVDYRHVDVVMLEEMKGLADIAADANNVTATAAENFF
jgi:hypothetical protein